MLPGLSERQKYFSETIIFLGRLGMVMPFALIIATSLVAVGIVESEVFNFWVYYTLCIVLLCLAYLRIAHYKPTLWYETFFLYAYQLVGVLVLLFVVGFNTPFTILWLTILLGAYVNFGRDGYLICCSILFATAVADIFLHPFNGVSYYITVLFYCIFISGMGYILAKMLRLSASSQKALQHTRSEEITQRDRLNTLLNSIAEGVLTTSKRGIVRLQNASVLSLMDTNESLVGKHVNDIFSLVDENNKKVPAEDLLRNVKTMVARADLIHKFTENDFINLNIQISPIRTSFRGEGESGYIIILRDTTKEKSLEEERDEFISVVSHELRTPVAISEGSLGNLLMMQDRKMDAKLIHSAAETAHEQVVYLANMVNDLSTLSRAERGASDAKQQIDLNALFEGLYAKYQDEAAKKGLQLNLDIHPRLPKVVQSRLYLEEMLQNFITNAIKYTREGSVTIHALRTAEGVECAVSDTGIGISKSDQNRVFQKFYRSEDYRTRETNGTGLGLYVVKKLASKIGVTIIFNSRINHGSRFGFVLPVEQKPN